jgi:hypothetical protein
MILRCAAQCPLKTLLPVSATGPKGRSRADVRSVRWNPVVLACPIEAATQPVHGIASWKTATVWLTALSWAVNERDLSTGGTKRIQNHGVRAEPWGLSVHRATSSFHAGENAQATKILRSLHVDYEASRCAMGRTCLRAHIAAWNGDCAALPLLSLRKVVMLGCISG